MTDEVRIWRIGPEVLDAAICEEDAPRIKTWRELLSAEEMRRADAFHREEDRRAYIASHAALRIVLSRLMGCTAASVRFTSENGSKPKLLAQDGCEAVPELCFNLTHSGRMAMIAVGFGREVGVDVEWQRPMEDIESLARVVMNTDELGVWMGLETGERFRAFYNLWVRKESYLKAIGLGLFRDLLGVTVPVGAELSMEPTLVKDSNGTEMWWLRDVEAGEGFSAAVCWQGTRQMSLVMEEVDGEELSLL